MQSWQPHRSPILNGDFVVEFMDSSTAIVSFDHPMFPDDPGDMAREVVILGIIEGVWSNRETAIEDCLVQAKDLLSNAGYM